MTAGDVSPLLNAFEAGALVGSPCPRVDGFRVDMAPEPRAGKVLRVLARPATGPGPGRGARRAERAVLVGARLYPPGRAVPGTHALGGDG